MDFSPIFKNLSRYIQLSEYEAQLFASKLYYRKLKRKEFLLREGDICRFENFVIKGCLRTYSVDKYGAEHVVMFATEDWWTGDLYSFLTQNPTGFNIDALEDSEIFQIEKTKLEQLYIQIPQLERFFRIMLQNAFIAHQKRIMQNLSFTAEERYINFQKLYPQLEQRVSQKQIASFLMMTPEFLSMIRRKIAGK